jgi:hypothetical protein
MPHDHPEFYHHGSLSIHSLLGLLGLTRFLTACSTQTSQWKKRSTSDQHGLFGWWFADLKRFEVTYDRPLPISIIDVTSQTLVAKATSALACGQYIVHPTWITESVAAKRRLPERHFSLMARISQGRTRRTRRTGWWRTRETKTRVELVVVYVGSVIVFFVDLRFTWLRWFPSKQQWHYTMTAASGRAPEPFDRWRSCSWLGFVLRIISSEIGTQSDGCLMPFNSIYLVNAETRGEQNHPTSGTV